MKVSRTKLASILAPKVRSASSSKQVAKTIAAFLIDQAKVSELASLLRDIQEDWAQDGYVNLVATSAFPLSAAVKQDITNQVHSIYPKLKKVVIDERIDPTILSGVKLELANYRLDLSAETKLDKLRQMTA
jgi:F0F1-type ATP synthase delta subunit